MAGARAQGNGCAGARQIKDKDEKQNPLSVHQSNPAHTRVVDMPTWRRVGRLHKIDAGGTQTSTTYPPNWCSKHTQGWEI